MLDLVSRLLETTQRSTVQHERELSTGITYILHVYYVCLQQQVCQSLGCTAGDVQQEHARQAMQAHAASWAAVDILAAQSPLVPRTAQSRALATLRASVRRSRYGAQLARGGAAHFA